MTSPLAGRIAVITGGGSGLGAAMARVFAEAGMGVAALDIDGAAAQHVAEAVHAEFAVPVTSASVDIGDATSVADAARHVEAALGGCDVCCANVGVQQFGAIDKLTDARLGVGVRRQRARDGANGPRVPPADPRPAAAGVASC